MKGNAGEQSSHSNRKGLVELWLTFCCFVSETGYFIQTRMAWHFCNLPDLACGMLGLQVGTTVPSFVTNASQGQPKLLKVFQGWTDGSVAKNIFCY